MLENQIIHYDIETTSFYNSLAEFEEQDPDLYKIWIAKQLPKKSDPDMSDEERYFSSAPLLPYFSRICCISFGVATDYLNIMTLAGADEKALLKKFNSLLRSSRFNQWVMCWFNIKQFDNGFTAWRMAKYGIQPPAQLNAVLWNKFNNMEKGAPWHLTKSIDLMELTNQNKGHASFDITCRHFNVPSPKEQGFDGSQVGQAYREGRITEIAEYCARDVYSSYMLYEEVRHIYGGKDKPPRLATKEFFNYYNWDTNDQDQTTTSTE